MKFVRRVLPYAKPHWHLAAGCAALTLGATGLALLTPWPLKILIDHVIGTQKLPGAFQNFQEFLTTNRLTVGIVIIAAGLLIVLLENVFTVINSYAQTKLEQRMVLDLRSKLFQHAMHLPLAFHDSRRSGMLIYAINYQADSAAGVLMAIPQLAQSVITLVGMFAICWWIDPRLAGLSLAVVPFLYWAVKYYSTHIQKKLRAVKEIEGESLSIVHEAVSMTRVITAFGREDHEYKKFRAQGAHAVEQRVRVTVQQTLFSLFVNVVTALGTAAVLSLGAYFVLRGGLTIGQLLVVMAYIAAVYRPLESITHTVGQLQDMFVNLQIAFELLDTEASIRNLPHAKPLKNVLGQVTFDNVNFSYSGRANTLSHVSFNVEPGQVVGLVGPTGAGKTTIMSLIPRFYEPTAGRVLIDGVDVRDITLESLRQQISIVSQEPLLFSSTIADNIRYGRLDASMDDVIEAARQASAHDFIMALPDGYQTVVGERGACLSGGERQRICIARAFLKNAPILILDEPTSSVDARTESTILEALNRLMLGRTTFMIAHRLSTLRSAGLILVIDGGKIVERGTHEQLLAHPRLYAQLHGMQTRGASSETEATEEAAAL